VGGTEVCWCVVEEVVGGTDCNALPRESFSGFLLLKSPKTNSEVNLIQS